MNLRSKSYDKITPFRSDDIYKQRLDYPVKGFEFEAIARKGCQTAIRRRKSPQTSPRKERVKFKVTENSPIKTFIQTQPTKSYSESQSPEKPKAPQFDKQSTGKIAKLIDANENRFAFNPRDKDYLGKTRFCPAPVASFDKNLPRNFYNQCKMTPSMILNTDEHKNTAKGLIIFDKMIARNKANFIKKDIVDCIAHDPDNVVKKFDKLSTVKRTTTPNFDHVKGRYYKGQVLPSYMENLNNRMSIAGLSGEMIKQNAYIDMELPSTLPIQKIIKAVDYDHSKALNRPKKIDLVTSFFIR